MMRILYIIAIVVLFLFLMIIYFTNIMWLGNMNMYLGSQSNNVPVSVGLLMIISSSFLLGFCAFGLFTTFLKKKPKDYDEFDL